MKQFEEFVTNAQNKLEDFCDFLLKWQRTINLIAPSTIPNIWERHVLDSAQLYPLLPVNARKLVDMGSGGGFPALVLAILNQENNGPIQRFCLVESDTKKSIFLTEAARVFSLPVVVVNRRLETVCLKHVDVVTARALKPVKELLWFGRGFITPKTTCLFLKGERVQEELRKNPYECSVRIYPSHIYKTGCILKIKKVQIRKEEK